MSTPDSRRPHKGLEPNFDLPDDDLLETGEYPDPDEETVASEERPAVDHEAMLGLNLPGYRVLGILGQGGMGVVYRAIDEGLNREVAIKTLPAAMIGSEEARERFEREAQLLAKLQHEHIARVYQTGLTGQRPYFVMELIEGPSLAEKISGKPLAPRDSARILFDLAEGLEESHRQGVIHRDLKPSNVLFDRRDTVKVTDFGLARLRGDSSSVTRTGDVVGTPSYMAPEQASGVVKQMKPTTDVYGMGAILYEMLTGRPVFQAPEPAQVLLMVLQMEPVPPRQLQPAIPRDLETICLRCLEKSPSRRYPTARAVAEDLHRYLIGEPIHARPVSRWERGWRWVRRHPWQSIAAATVAIALLSSIGGFAWHNQQLSRELQRTRSVVDQGRELSSWLLKDYLAELESPSGLTEKRAKLVEQLVRFLDAIGEEAGQYRESGRELARSYELIATLQGDPFDLSLGRVEEAEQFFNKAVAIRVGLVQAEPHRSELQTERDHSRMMLALFYLGQQRVRESEELLGLVKRDFLKRCPAYETQELLPLDFNLWTGILSLEGDLAASRGNYSAACEAYRQVNAWLAAGAHVLSADGRLHAEVIALERLADALQQRGDYAEAIKLTDTALEKIEASLNETQEPVQMRAMLVSFLIRKGDLASLLGDQDEAQQLFDQADGQIADHILPVDPENLTLLSKQSLIWGRQANIALLKQDFERGLRLAQQSHERCRELATAHPTVAILQEKWYTSFANVVLVYMQTGELEKGKQKIAELLELLEPLATSDSPARLHVRLVGEAYQNLGLTYAQSFSEKLDAGQTVAELESDYQACQQAFARSLEWYAKLASDGRLEGAEAQQQSNVREISEYLKSVWEQLQQATEGELKI